MPLRAVLEHRYIYGAEAPLERCNSRQSGARAEIYRTSTGGMSVRAKRGQGDVPELGSTPGVALGGKPVHPMPLTEERHGRCFDSPVALDVV